MSALLFVTILFVAVNSAYALCGAKISTREDVLLLGAVIIDFIAVYMLSVSLRCEHIKIKQLDGIIQLIKDGENTGIIFIDKQFVKTCSILIVALITMFVALELFTVVVFWIAGDYSWAAYRRLCTDTCVFMQGTVGTHYVTLHFLLLNMLQKTLLRLKDILDRRLNDSTDENINRSPPSVLQEIFVREVRHFCRFYRSVHMNLLEDNNFVGPAVLIWWNAVLAVNIISVYIMLNSIMIQEPLGVVSIFFILKVYGCMIGIIIYLAEVEVTTSVVSFQDLAFELLVMGVFYFYNSM